MRILSVLLLVFGLSGPVSAQGADIENVIDGQIQAFLADDVERAFGFASPTIQQMFRTPQNFGMMVQRGYPMVWRPEELRYLELREIAGALWQKVLIRDQKGGVHILDYQMIPTENGWKINGVQVVPAPELAA